MYVDHRLWVVISHLSSMDNFSKQLHTESWWLIKNIVACHLFEGSHFGGIRTCGGLMSSCILCIHKISYIVEHPFIINTICSWYTINSLLRVGCNNTIKQNVQRFFMFCSYLARIGKHGTLSLKRNTVGTCLHVLNTFLARLPRNIKQRPSQGKSKKEPRFIGIHSSPKERQLQKSCGSFETECKILLMSSNYADCPDGDRHKECTSQLTRASQCYTGNNARICCQTCREFYTGDPSMCFF